MSRTIQRRGTFGLNSDDSSASSELPFVDAEDPEEQLDRELTRSEEHTSELQSP